MSINSKLKVEQSPPAKSQETKSNSEHWADLFLSEFAKESDRAAVIVAASIFDNSLRDLLRQFLVPNATATDELFDGTNAPLSTFSAKIAFAHRLGLISGSFARNLHLIRRIRNEFAHNIHGGSFEDTAVKSRVTELYKSQVYKTQDSPKFSHQKGARGEFLTVCVWMVWVLTSMVEKTNQINEAKLEFGFISKKTKERTKKQLA